MSAPVKRRPSRTRRFCANGARLALECARAVYAEVDRRMPEAAALAEWMGEHGASLGLPEAVLPDIEREYRASRARARVSALRWSRTGAALDQAAANLPDGDDTAAAYWLSAAGAAVGLDALSARILALAVLYRVDRRVDRLFDLISACRGGPCQMHRDPALFALLLGAESSGVAERLAPDSRLLASGLVYGDTDGELRPLERLVSLIRRDPARRGDVRDALLGGATTEALPWEAFAHLGREADIAASMLRAALAGRESGINILLYGPPGTGKTSFAATLAARAGARLRPVGEAGDDGDEPNRNERLAGLRLAQRLCHRESGAGDTLLLFDEAEDLFAHRALARGEAAGRSRVFIHRMLEQGSVPVIWTANDIGALGPAVARRMTMCLELRVPSLATRTLLWRRMGEAEGVILPEDDAARLARLVPAAPAVAAAALRATRLAGGGAVTARLIVEGIARAVHGGALPAPEAEPDTGYDPALVNADGDLARLTETLTRPGAPLAVSFLLSGPPGAGKSAWVRHLAGRMGLPVLQKRGSDLLDCFVGGTEGNIADAFARARETRSFLVFDEADSLLLERTDAVRGWEISQVNEMLSWMESHPLPFACTTNLAERLDRASLRRFLVKLRFDWLTPAQARLAFARFFGLPAPAGLEALRTLTPADFALVRRRAAVEGGETDPATLLRLLAAEATGRVGGRLPVGFARPAAA